MQLNRDKVTPHDLYEEYRRLYPIYRGPHKLKRVLGWLDESELRIGTVIFVLAATIIFFLDWRFEIAGKDVLVEAHGLLMDLLVFGCLILWFNQRRDKRSQIRHYQETLMDLSAWDSREGVLRKVGTLNRLIDVGVETIPPLDYIQLPEANLQGIYLPGVDLAFANLQHGFLNGTHLRNAVLSGADLSYACLAYAVLEDTDLRGTNLSNVDLEGVKLAGAVLGLYTAGQLSSQGSRTYRTDLRGVTGLNPVELQKAEGWEEAYRDSEFACGRPIPNPQNDPGVTGLK